MTVFVDTGVFVAHQNRRDRDHAAAVGAMKSLTAGNLGRPYSSDYVFDEAVTLARRRTGSHGEALRVANRILGRGGYPKVFDLLMITGPVFRDAVQAFTTYDDRRLSFTDATTIALAQRYRIDQVLSFDRDLDGLVQRTDPRDVG